MKYQSDSAPNLKIQIYVEFQGNEDTNSPVHQITSKSLLCILFTQEWHRIPRILTTHDASSTDSGASKEDGKPNSTKKLHISWGSIPLSLYVTLANFCSKLTWNQNSLLKNNVRAIFLNKYKN